jgi:hypothetical protein
LRAFRQGDDLAVLIRGTTDGAILTDYYVAAQNWTIEDPAGAQTTPQAVADATAAPSRTGSTRSAKNTATA